MGTDRALAGLSWRQPHLPDGLQCLVLTRGGATVEGWVWSRLGLGWSAKVPGPKDVNPINLWSGGVMLGYYPNLGAAQRAVQDWYRMRKIKEGKIIEP